ncbi:MAG: hypothetical protein ABI881_08800 [Betaproteobacteria bacterium]
MSAVSAQNVSADDKTGFLKTVFRHHSGKIAATLMLATFAWYSAAAVRYVPDILVPRAGALAHVPEWRMPMTVGQFSEIPNTANLNGTTTNHSTIDAWNGLGAGQTQWWSLANGGHEDSSENKVIAIDLADNVPTWKVVNPGSAPQDVPPKINLLYYFDGLPASSHSYYTTQYIGARDRVMRFSTGVVWGNGNGGGPVVDGFRLQDKRWDPQGTWPSVPIALSTVVTTIAKDPETEDVYVANNGSFAKWTQVTNTWATFLPIGPEVQWQFHGSVIDVLRKRWVFAGGLRSLDMIDLVTHAHFKLALTGIDDAPPFGDYDAIVHDLDNDRYLLQTGSRVYGIDPNNGAATIVATVPVAATGPLSRFAYFATLGGVAYLPDFSSNILFMPTRAEESPPPPQRSSANPIVVEYYHSGFDHFFMTALPDEIAALDAGEFPPWERTGQSFKAYLLDAPGMANECRFFSVAFAPKSSHFYTPLASECALTRNNPDWVFEGEVFSVSLATSSGACAEGNIPLYRLYNNGIGGAPNHRYTTSPAIHASMVGVGWIAEGSGNDGVSGCVLR